MQDYYYNHNVGLFSVQPASYSSPDATVLGSTFLLGVRDFHHANYTTEGIPSLKRDLAITPGTNALEAPMAINWLSFYNFFGMQRYGSEWHFVQKSDDKKLKKISTAGVVELVATTASAIRSFALVTESSADILYYCDSASIKRHDIATASETTLDLKVSGLICTGRSLGYFEDGGDRYLLSLGYLNEMYIIFTYKL